MDPILLGGVCTRLCRTRHPTIARSKYRHQTVQFHGALNLKPRLSHHRKFQPFTCPNYVDGNECRYTGYPFSVLNNNKTSNGLTVNPQVKSNLDAGLGAGPARHATHVKIESPSVTAAAKKAATDKVEAETPDAESSTTSDEDTLVSKSKSSKSFGTDEVVLSPTKSKL